MNPKWIVFTVTVWLVLALLGSIMEKVYVGSYEHGVINTLIQMPVFSETTLWGRITGMVTDWAWIGAFIDMIAFNFKMFEGGWLIFQWIFFLPLSAALVICLALAAIRGVSSG